MELCAGSAVSAVREGFLEETALNEDLKEKELVSGC